MEKHYIAPSLTVVAIQVERGYAESIPSSDDNVKLDLDDLTKDKGAAANTPEDRAVSNNWGAENGGFWSTTYE